MNCTEYLAESSRCERGIPVARLFRHYFCEGDHKGCPLKRMKKMEIGRSVKCPENSFTIRGGSMKCTRLISRGKRSSCKALDKPYVPSLFELGEYCRTTDHKKCPFYLRGIISMNQTESNTRRASL